ncbi:hypothetical protein MNBD_GAMMA22-1522 [hydrothermal vent metagenome]|uniref:Glutathione S-transferase n=1 Tax=hydrothermal vent metagenome TaxID=652676 RepID=A0A3B1A0L0_9ZZZZ
MNITLYYCAETRADRIRWLLEELNLPYKLNNIDIFSGEGQNKEYLKIHPYGQVPAIDIDGELTYESGAICNILADRFPEKKLSPVVNSQHRAQYEQWMFFTVASLEPPIFQHLLHTFLLPTELRIPEIAQWNLKSYRRVLITLEKIMKISLNKSQTDQLYLLDIGFSCADIMLGSILFWAPEIVSKYPTLYRYSENLKNRKAYQRTILTYC